MWWERWCFSSHGGPAASVTCHAEGSGQQTDGTEDQTKEEKRACEDQACFVPPAPATYVQNQSHDRTANLKMRGGTSALDFV